MNRSEQGSFSPRAVGGRKFVAIFHPAYPYSAPPLLTLPAVDSIREGGRGINYNTAKEACGIIACNRWGLDAYFALRIYKRGCEVQWSKWPCGKKLCAGGYDYYFIIGKPDYRYPVVPGFDHWRFPHGALPPRWASLVTPETETETETETNSCDGDVGDGDGENVGDVDDLAHPDSVAFAHIAPFSHKSWLASNKMDKYFRRNRPAASNVKRLLDDIHGRFPRCSTGLQGHRSSRFELHPRLLLEAIVTKVEKNTGHRNSPSTDYIQREHLFARFAFHVLSEANFRFLGGVHKYSVRLFDLRRAEHFTAELYSDNIEELCEIFPSLNSTRGLSSQGRKTPPSQQPDDSYDDTSDSDGEAPLSHHGDALKYRQAARRRYRSPAYYTFRFCPKGYIDTANTEHEEATKDRGNPRPASSTGGLSLASTLTVSSLKTPNTDRGSEDLADPNDKSNLDATQICSKHPSDHDGLTNASPPSKRRRLA